VNNGAADIDLIKELFTKDADGSGEADFHQAMKNFKSMTIELTQIAESSETVLTVIKGVRDLKDEVSELTDAWVSPDMAMFDSLNETVQTAVTELHGLVDQVDEQCEKIKLLVEEYTNGVLEQSTDRTNAFVAEMKAVVGSLGGEGGELEQFKTVFADQIEPLIPKLEAGVRQLTDKAKSFALSMDAPENVAAEKMNKWTGCAWRSTRWFDTIEDVDISTTMTCEMEWFGRYKCQCIGWNDCYATEYYRPASDQATKRCFKQVGWGWR